MQALKFKFNYKVYDVCYTMLLNDNRYDYCSFHDFSYFLLSGLGNDTFFIHI